MKPPPAGIIKTLAAISSGLLLTAAFPKVDMAWTAWFALLPLLMVLRNATAKEGFRLGFIAGLAHYMTLLYWVVGTMKTYGHLPLYLCVPVLFLFSAYLALYVGAFAWLSQVLCRGPVCRLFLPPVLWVSLEYLRSVLLTGFPWELLGYSQYKTLTLIQIADLLGVYGVSCIIVLGNTAISHLCIRFWEKGRPKDRISGWTAAGSILAVVVIFTVVWFYGKTRLTAVDRQMAAAPLSRIAVIQGNIDQAVKWNRAFQASTVEKYIRLSLSTQPDRPALVVWPETAAPFYFLHHAKLTGAVFEGVRNAGTHFLIGSNALDRKNERFVYYNSAFLIAPDGTISGRYDKVHLVPFGEYVPLKKWLPFLGKMVEHVGDFQPGKPGEPLRWKNERLGILICYEVIFPGLSRRLVKNSASLLVNITNDAWYGRSSAPFQHFSMAVFRAVENRRALIRSANTGISGFIDPAGRITAATSLFQDAALTGTVPILKKVTAYTRFGDLFAAACLALTAAMMLWAAVRRSRP